MNEMYNKQIIITLLLDDYDQILGIKIDFTKNNDKEYCNNINKCNTDCFKFIISQKINNYNVINSYSGIKHIVKNINQ